MIQNYFIRSVRGSYQNKYYTESVKNYLKQLFAMDIHTHGKNCWDFLCFFRKTPLRMYFTLYHRGVVGTNRELPLSMRQDRRLQACLFCVPKSCLELSTATDLFPEEGKAGLLHVAYVSFFQSTCSCHLSSVLSPQDTLSSGHSSCMFSSHFQPFFPVCASLLACSRAGREVTSLASTGRTWGSPLP